MFENVLKCNIITSKRETCFEKSEVWNGFINDISKPRIGTSVPERVKKEGGHIFLITGEPLSWGGEAFKGWG